MSRGQAARTRPLDVTVAAGLTVLVLGPVLLERGFVLRGDMVFVPDQPWKGAWLGLDGGVPRAVPMDAVVWLLGLAVPGDVVQKALLAGSLLVGGLGAARLARTGWGRTAATTVFLWNPWVAERLAIGQWAAVAGYALLPWLLRSSLRWRDGEPGGWGSTAILLVLSAVCAPSMGLVAAAVAVAVLLGRPRADRLLVLLGTVVLANLPWLVPSVLRPDRIDPPAGQFAAFASHAESPLGVLGSVLSLGGIWKESIVPPERGSALVVACSVLLTALCLVGAAVAARQGSRRALVPLGVLGALCVLLGCLPAWGPVADLLDDAARGLPAVGILRDSHRYLGPFGLLLAVGAGALADVLAGRAGRGREGLLAVAGLLVVLPVVLLPSLAWGLRGGLDPVPYPREWSTTARLLDDASPGSTVVLPWTGSYRGYAWNGHRSVLDPAPRFFPGEVLIDDRMYVDRVLAPEDPYLARVGAALRLPPEESAAALRRLGVSRVLVEHGNGVRAADVPAGTEVHDGPGLRLVDLGEAGPDPRDRLARAPVVAGDLATVGLLAAGAVAVLRERRRDKADAPVSR
jgi:hypothetical protein